MDEDQEIEDRIAAIEARISHIDLEAMERAAAAGDLEAIKALEAAETLESLKRSRRH
jgi:hypothetical protein